MTPTLLLQLPSSAVSVWQWHLVPSCTHTKRVDNHHPLHGAVLGFLAVNMWVLPILVSHLPTLTCFWHNYFCSSFSSLLSEKLERVQLYKAMASTFFMSEIFGVMYVLLAWLLLNLEIKQSDTEYIALSIGFIQVKNADHTMSIPCVQKHYFTTGAVNT